MKSRLDYADNKRTLNIYEDLNIQNAGEFISVLKESFEGAGILSINLESVTEIDLSCLQLLCALHKSALSTGKTICLEYARSPAVIKAIHQAGCARMTGCKGNEKCFWSEALHG